MKRVVVDTNILLSALLFGGLPGMFLDLAFLKSFTVLTSNVLLDELDEKLRLKFRVSAEEAQEIRLKLAQYAEIVKPTERLTVVHEDPDDDRVLECAIAGRANSIVSGDRHLLKIGTYNTIPILTVRQFMDELRTDA